MHGWKNVPEENDPKPRSEIDTGNGQKNVPESQFEKRTDIEIKQRNKTNKQSRKPSALTGEAAVTFEKLREAGFDATAARAMALRFPLDRVERQINWIDGRNARRNRLGMLRKAIEQDWAKPSGEKLSQPNSGDRRGDSFSEAVGQIARRLRDQSS